MPSKSKAQKSLMDAVAHSPSFASKVGIPQKVGKDFDEADRAAGLNATHNGRPIPHKNLKNLPGRVKKATGGILKGAGAGSGLGRINKARASRGR